MLNCPIEDIIYCTRDNAIFTAAEMAVGVIVACVPTLGVLLPSRWENSRKARYQHRESDRLELKDYKTKRFNCPTSSRGEISAHHLISDLDKQDSSYGISASPSEVRGDSNTNDSLRSMDISSYNVWVMKEIHVSNGSSLSKSSINDIV